ncbi:hypothetical protein ASO20_02630 [Mycoplasma sp. (ex Biomphalaria glabrata)]|uniref:APC family permease n=1 Tax=Mycoplasma sp. (ex Biomphalaria glabrata) TaxID=1749074 RepID=UPI00073ABE3E|nr:APC family permease [Mycoplasma sp. (ex Biomphalaria glabrata)]ALV23531.1 hypothetical protein ASO20_02630 [Mycoplasma sp. (ex Biomphalaria glabrata)]
MSTKKRFSKWGGLFFSLNIIVGYAFVVGLGSSIQASGLIGMPLILLACAIVAFGAGIVFGTFAEKYSGYGGAYIYVKHGLGKKWAFFIGWCQYIQGPFCAISAIAAIVWSFQGANFFGWDLTNTAKFDEVKPILFAISTILFIIFIIIVNLGFRSTRLSLWLTWGLKWFVIILSLIFAFICIGKLIAENNSHKIIDNITGKGFHYNGNFFEIITSVLTFFFAFGGFEGAAAMSDDMTNAKKNMSFILIGSIIIATFFNFIYYFVFLAALGVNQNDPTSIIPNGTLDSNPINSVILNVLGGATGVFIAITSLCVLSQVGNNSATCMQNSWIDTRLLLPLAIEGWLPKSWTRVNKHGQFSKCLIFDSILTIVLMVVYALGASFATDDIANNLSNTLGIYSLITFINYLGTMTSAFVLWRKKELVFKKWELVICFSAYALIFLTILGFFTQWIYFVVTSNGSALKGFIFQFIAFTLAMLTGLSVYLVGKKRYWETRTQWHPSFIAYVKLNPEAVNEKILKRIHRLESEKYPDWLFIEKA